MTEEKLDTSRPFRRADALADGITAKELRGPRFRVIVEYDGRQHVERIEAWESDLERREAIDDDGWRILVVVASGIYKSPERTLERVRRLLLARGLEGTPARLDDEWPAHFPGHSPDAARTKTGETAP